MKTDRVKLNGLVVRDEILKASSTEEVLIDVANGIKSRAQSNADAKVEVKKLSNRKNRAAVDIICDRTEDVVKNHVLEKAI